MNKASLISLFLGCVFIYSANVCSAYEYHASTELEKSKFSMDREINLYGLDCIDIGLHHTQHQTHELAPHIWSTTMFFTRDQITLFLQKERHKDMLLVHVSKMRMGEPNYFAKIRPFLESFAYKRILVLEDRAFLPIPVLLDETLNDLDIEQKERIRSMKVPTDVSTESTECRR